MSFTLLESFYNCTLQFNKTDYQKYLKQVEKIKKNMGSKYLLDKSNYIGKK